MFDILPLNTIGQRYRTYRQRQKLSRDIARMSSELRKDIGWPTADFPYSDTTSRIYAAGQANLGSMR